MADYQVLTPAYLPKKGERLLFIDALRGITIILVVFSHLVTLAIAFDEISILKKINDVLIIFRMPLFFFISGFFVYSNKYNMELVRLRSKNRIISQLYPTLLLMSILCIFFFDSNFPFAFSHELKIGYWFTLTVVEMFFLTLPILVILSRFNNISLLKKSIIVFIYSFVIFRLLGLWYAHNPIEINRTLGLSLLLSYLPYFVFGILFRINYEFLHKIFSNFYVAIFSFITFFICLWKLNFNYVSMIEALLAIIFLYALTFHLFNVKKIVNNKVNRFLVFIGSMTLEIYLLHYFIIYSLGKIINSEDLINFKDSIWLFIAVLITGILICLVCLLIVKLLKTANIYKYLFPKKK